jgi:hypothetical protein
MVVVSNVVPIAIATTGTYEYVTGQADVSGRGGG